MLFSYTTKVHAHEKNNVYSTLDVIYAHIICTYCYSVYKDTEPDAIMVTCEFYLANVIINQIHSRTEIVKLR